MLPISYRFQLGNFECLCISDGSHDYELSRLFSNVPEKEVQAEFRRRNLPVDYVRSPYTCMFVNTGEHRVLVDTGAGHRYSDSDQAGHLLQNMIRSGVKPDDVDTLIITHAHPDHVGALLDDEKRPVFTRARHLIPKKDWDFWFSENAYSLAPKRHILFARETLEPLQHQIELLDFEQDTEIMPGVQAIAAPGHVPGQISVSFTSKNEQLINISDLVVHPIHLEHPDWVGPDYMPEEAAKSRRRILDRISDKETLVFAHHFPPFPNLGYIVKAGEGWQWRPISPEW
jgi:glyoxylase-like metal-dependent hydrolase (beta-lactamase superfamily II)